MKPSVVESTIWLRIALPWGTMLLSVPLARISMAKLSSITEDCYVVVVLVSMTSVSSTSSLIGGLSMGPVVTR